MMKLADKLNIVEIKEYGVVVDMYDLIEKNISKPEFNNLFKIVTTDAIMEDIDNILSGCVPEEWLIEFVDVLEV